MKEDHCCCCYGSFLLLFDSITQHIIVDFIAKTLISAFIRVESITSPSPQPVLEYTAFLHTDRAYILFQPNQQQWLIVQIHYFVQHSVHSQHLVHHINSTTHSKPFAIIISRAQEGLVQVQAAQCHERMQPSTMSYLLHRFQNVFNASQTT